MRNEYQLAKQEKIKTLDWLIDTFPAAFFKRANSIRPLKIGVYDDIIEFYQRLEAPPFSKNLLKQALNYYSASPAYLNCQIEGAARVDLLGNEIDVVTKEQEKYAHERRKRSYLAKQQAIK